MDAFLELIGEVYVTHQFFSNKHGDLSLFSVLELSYVSLPVK